MFLLTAGGLEADNL